MRRWTFIPILLLSALGTALPAIGADADVELLEQRLGQLEQRLAAPGSGLLARTGQSVVRLEDLMQRGEYRRFHDFVAREIVVPWREVRANQAALAGLADSPPHQLSPAQRAMLRRSQILVRQINSKLRRLRRLLTRVDKLGDESRRRFMELERAQGRYEQLLADLERIAPERVAGRRAWLDSRCRGPREGLRDRRRLLDENMERLRHWSEDPSLKNMLRDLGRMNRTMERLHRQFGARSRL